MRTYGRDANGTWVKIETGPNGDNSSVWAATLVQTIRLNRGESPFWGNYGIPAQQSVEAQIAPDLYMAQTQQQFSQYFSSLSLYRDTPVPPDYKPVYQMVAVSLSGERITKRIPT